MNVQKTDFTIQANKGGYMVYYKGKGVTGAGTLSGGKNLRGRAAHKQVKDYYEMGRYTIDSLIRECESESGNYYPIIKAIEEGRV
jgi:predicted component of type VI protein secretion system